MNRVLCTSQYLFVDTSFCHLEVCVVKFSILMLRYCKCAREHCNELSDYLRCFMIHYFKWLQDLQSELTNFQCTVGAWIIAHNLKAWNIAHNEWVIFVYKTMCLYILF